MSAARILILNDLFVSPKARCLGIASKLLEAAASYGRAVGSVRLTLSTAVDNEAAQAVYVSKGWVRDRVFCTFNLAL